MITNDAQKMAPVLSQIVENEDIHGSLKGTFLHIVGSMYQITPQKTAFLQAHVWAILKILVIAIDAAKMALVLSQIVENEDSHDFGVTHI